MQPENISSNRSVFPVVLILVTLALCCLVMVVMGILVAGLGARFAGQIGNFGSLTRAEASRSFQESYQVETPVTLSIRVPVGNVTVTALEGNEVSVDATITAYGATQAAAQESLSQVRLEVTESGDQVEVVGSWPALSRGPQGQSPRIDLRVQAPSETSFVLDLDVGESTVRGLAGNVNIQTDVGQVTVEDVAVADQLEIKTDVAEIRYEGSLTEGATYRMVSDVGSISVDIPADSEFQIDAASNLGTVSVDFDVVGETSREFTSQAVKGTVGVSDTLLYLRSSVGAISVR